MELDAPNGNEGRHDDPPPERQAPQRRPGGSRMARTALAGLGALAAACALLGLLDRQRQLARLDPAIASIQDSGRRDGASTRAQREVDPLRRQLVVSSALIADSLDPAAWEGDPEATLEDRVESMVDRLRTANDLATQVLAARPGSWRANLYSGASLYLMRSLLRDEKLVREPEDWRTPLRRAAELAPLQSEPRAFLALTQLELWQMLSEERRLETRELLRDAWSGAPLDRRILAAWIRVAPKDPSLLDPIAPSPYLLLWTQHELAQIGRWDLVLLARRRQLEVELAAVDRALEAARAAIRLGDLQRAREVLLSALPATPTSPHAESVRRILDLLPPGPLSRVNAEALSSWLVWTLDLDLYGGATIGAEAVARMEILSAGLSPWERARARLLTAGGDAAERLRAELVATRPGDSASSDDEAELERATGWAIYELHLATHRLRQAADGGSGRIAAGRDAALPETPRVPAAHRLLLEWLRLGGSAESSRIGDWIASEQAVWTAELMLDQPIEEIVLPFERVPRGGTVVEVSWNGTLLGVFDRFAAQSPLRLLVAADAGVHRLQVRAPYATAPVPGRPELVVAGSTR
ncbi:MAG: hypothetical protein DWQ36_05040 [Acidobacteria bacterium]|nr:MAG: hypothetical protein DWQ30_10480 [Acidobacteriota bacterium]REK10150.1 MAG: hypothetical protein DWQ36_05040 [Acidobacteriota bacterium]